MGKGGGKQSVTEFNMSMHIVLGVPIDALLEIKIGEKTAWAGNRITRGQIRISAPELFGGVKKEGGVRGTAFFLPGDADQKIPTGLAGRLAPGLTQDTCPGFRGMASVFLFGDAVADSTWSPSPGTSDGGGGGGPGSGGGTGETWTPPGGGDQTQIDVDPGDQMELDP